MNDSVRARPVAIDGRGLAAAVSAFLMWGLYPLFLQLLQTVPVVELTAHRVTWGCLFGFGWLALRGEIHHVWRALADPHTRWKLCASAALIAANWGLFVWGIATHQVVEISLGYFIVPLLSVALGVLLFRERLNRAQWLSVVIAAAGVLYLTWTAGRPPWLALGLVMSFGLYGLVRKVATVEALPGFTGETLLLFPVAAGYILWREFSGIGALSHSGLGTNGLLLLAGPLTTFPLVWFAVGARRIPLSTVGLLQYITPSMQLLCAIWLFNETFTGTRVIGFMMIWLALAIFAIDGLLASRRRS